MPPRKYKVVLDTNIIVSGVLTSGKSFELLALWKKGCFNLIICSEILEEYFNVLSRDKFCLPLSLIKTILDELSQKGAWIKKSSRLDIIKDDPDDNKFIESALDGDADYIISRDNHLLKLSKFKGLSILTPEEFVDLLNK